MVLCCQQWLQLPAGLLAATHYHGGAITDIRSYRGTEKAQRREPPHQVTSHQSTLIMTPQMIGNKTSLCLKSRPFRCNKDKIKFRNTIPSHTAVSLQPAGDSLYIKPLSSLSLVPEIYRQTIGNNFPSLDYFKTTFTVVHWSRDFYLNFIYFLFLSA